MSDRSRRYFPFFLAALALATVFPGLFLSFEDSEIWGITSSRRILENPLTLTSAHFKPLFSLIYGSVVQIAANDWGALIASRWVTMAFAAAGLYSLYTLGLTLNSGSDNTANRSKTLATLAFFAIIGTLPVFAVHFSKVRSDSVASSLILIVSLVLFLLKDQRLARRCIYLSGSIAALLVTPKSIDLVIILGLFFRLTEKENSLENESPLLRFIWLFSPVILFSGLAILTSRELMLRTLIYWIDSYRSVDFTSASAWFAVTRTLVTGPIVILVAVMGAVVGVLSSGKLNARERTCLLVGGVALAFILVHSQKYFFFLASRVPFLALGALPGLLRLVDGIDGFFKPKRSVALKVLVAAFCMSLFLTVSTLQNYSGFYLRYQKAVYQTLSNYLQRSDVTHYWDAIGLFPKRNSIYHYPSPGDETNQRILEYVEFSRPRVVLRSSKMELLEPDMISWLSTKYIPLGDQIFIRFLTLGATPNCRLSKSLLLEKIDGQNLKPPLALFTKIGRESRWLRVPVRWTDGKTQDAIESIDFEGVDISIANCDQAGVQYAFTESKPWDELPAPVFSQFFGYDGTL